MTQDPILPFDNRYARLPPRFYSRQRPGAVAQPALIRANSELAHILHMDPRWLESATGVEVIAGNHLLPGSEPIATVYAGHQFGGWNPQLGDGRAVLLGELTGIDGVHYDIQLKGAGPTPYSRGGDGRAPLGPVLREYIVSEAMSALGIPSSRALAAVTTGESVYRDRVQPGAILARVAQSHIRIGTFQFFASRQDTEALALLADHVIQRHFPRLSDAANPYRAMLDEVVSRQARLIAKWQQVGFIHGVMNTDNMLVSGETIDYGPCAFMDDYDPGKVFSSIDQGGRYAYQNQPGIAHWNLACFAQTLLPLLDDDAESARASAQEAVDAFPDLFLEAYQGGMRRKIGLANPMAADQALVDDFLALMARHSMDFTLGFRRLAQLAHIEGVNAGDAGEDYQLPIDFEPWLNRWQARLAREPQDSAGRQATMFAVNPLYIPRNHLVADVIDAALEQRDFAPFHRLVEVLASPCDFKSNQHSYALPPQPEQIVEQTFCGT